MEMLIELLTPKFPIEHLWCNWSGKGEKRTTKDLFCLRHVCSRDGVTLRPFCVLCGDARVQCLYTAGGHRLWCCPELDWTAHIRLQWSHNMSAVHYCRCIIHQKAYAYCNTSLSLSFYSFVLCIYMVYNSTIIRLAINNCGWLNCIQLIGRFFDGDINRSLCRIPPQKKWLKIKRKEIKAKSVNKCSRVNAAAGATVA